MEVESEPALLNQIQSLSVICNTKKRSLEIRQYSTYIMNVIDKVVKSTSLSINKWVIILICVIIESTQPLQKQSYNICSSFVQYSIQPVPNLPVGLPPLDLWEAHDVYSSPGQVIRTSASYEEKHRDLTVQLYNVIYKVVKSTK